jgi:hypothetical protein
MVDQDQLTYKWRLVRSTFGTSEQIMVGYEFKSIVVMGLA